MLAKTIKYKDYDGNEREEVFYFNLSQADLVEMEMSENGGLQKFIKTIVATQDQPKIVEMFKGLILKSYGEKSLDGKYFLKEDPDTGVKLCNRFKQTEAYNVLFMELATDANKASDFVNKIIPAESAKALSEHKVAVPSVVD